MESVSSIKILKYQSMKTQNIKISAIKNLIYNGRLDERYVHTFCNS